MQLRVSLRALGRRYVRMYGGMRYVRYLVGGDLPKRGCGCGRGLSTRYINKSLAEKNGKETNAPETFVSIPNVGGLTPPLFPSAAATIDPPDATRAFVTSFSRFPVAVVVVVLNAVS